VLLNVDRQDPHFNEIYRKYVVEDIIGYVDRTFRTIPERGSRIIAGHSYSGGEAFSLAGESSSLFSLVGMFSPYFEIVPQANLFANHDLQKFPLLFYVYLGTKDQFSSIPINTRKAINVLEEWGFPHKYVEDDSDHWAMIGQRIEECIKYFSNYVVYDSSTSGIPHELWKFY